MEGLEKKQRDKEALELVQSRFNVSKAYTQGYFSRFQRYYELYRSYLQKGSLPWRSNLFIPKSFEIVETVAPRIAQAQRTFKVYPVAADDVETAEAYSSLLKWQFYKSHMEETIEELTKETLIYGTGVLKVTWNPEYNCPWSEVVDIYDFFPDPKARCDYEMKYVIHRVYRDLDDLKKNPNYNKAAIKKLEAIKSSEQDNSERKARLGVIGVNGDDSTRNRFEVLEYWGNFGNDGKQYIIVIANGQLLRFEENPYQDGIPFIVVNDTKVPHELYGIGEIEPIEALQNEINDVRNQRMDNTKLGINKMFKVVAGGVQFEDELVSRPGGIIHVTRPDGLLPNDTQPIPAEAFTEESIIKSDMERTTGANTAMSGALVSPMGGTQGGAINRTATAYQGSINQGDKRFSAKVNQIKIGIVKAGKKYLKYDQQFMTAPQVIRVVGKEGNEEFPMTIYPQDIKNDFDLEIDVEYIDEFQQAQQDAELLQIMSGVAEFNTVKLAQDILEKRGKKDVSKYLLPPTPPPKEQTKVSVILKGDIAPDASALILEQRDGIKSNPDVVASQMRQMQAQENAQQVEMEKNQAETMNQTEDATVQEGEPTNE